jgi:DNA invertase Pin-like site-specific DNA recombinase
MKNRKEKVVAAYVRVSTYDQQKGLESQVQALKKYCRNHALAPVAWFRDTISGATSKRPAFDKMQKEVFAGRISTIVVWRLDRISRKGAHEGLNLLADWLKKGIRIVSVTEQLDFDGPLGEMLAAIFFALARMERQLLIENTNRGLAAAKAKGVKFGRKPKLFISEILPMLESGQRISEVAREKGCTTQGIYMLLRRADVPIPHGKADGR